MSSINLVRNPYRNNSLMSRYPLGNALQTLSSKLFEFDGLATPQVLTLHPTGAAQTNSQIRFSFAIPFPKGALDDVANYVPTFPSFSLTITQSAFF